MNCDWTEKISLLIDGELPHDEGAEVSRHLDACAACRQAREDFLRFRQHLVAYRADINPLVESAALSAILASAPHRQTQSGAQPANEKTERTARGPRFAGAFWRNPFGNLSGAQTRAHAWVAASVLLAFALIIALALMLNARRDARQVASVPSKGSAPVAAPQHGARDLTSDAEADTRSATGNRHPKEEQRGGQPRAVRERIIRPRRAVPSGLPLDGAVRRGEVARAAANTAAAEATSQQAQAANIAANSDARELFDLPPVGGEASVSATGRGREFLVNTDFKTARHVEQAQLLLRSFRNARLAGTGGSASGIAYEKQRSQKLLYMNIVLRREAANKGDLPIESVLSSLEPILIDIANLPDRPASEDVRVIRERMQRKNIVAMLQISAARAQ